MKIKFFKKENNFKKANLHLDPRIFWRLAVFVLFVIIVFSSFFGYHLFVKINTELVPLANSDTGQVETVKKEKIDKVLEYFSLREQQSNKILNSRALVVDPSL